MLDFLFRECHRGFQNPARAVSRNAMNRTVGRIRTPCAVNSPVGRVLPNPEVEHAVDALPVSDDEQLLFGNVPPKLFNGRVCFSPLIWIAMFCHEFSGISVDFLNSPQIRQLCRTNCVFHDSSPFLMIIPHLHGFRNTRTYYEKQLRKVLSWQIRNGDGRALYWHSHL